MRLLSLSLQNFRQHAATEIRFQPGLTGIIGPNGAGKSTLLEAIAWAIYGAEAARGTNETLRFDRAGPRARVEVALRFELGGHEYAVVRTLSAAEVFLDGDPTPVATTLGGVTRYLQGRLGMNRREFFNTYFTGQKELQFLASMGPTERGRFLSSVLGYERLRMAQEGVREARNRLRGDVELLRAGLQDPAEVQAARASAEGRVGDAREALAGVEAQRAESAERGAVLAPLWEEAQAARERHRELTHAGEAAARDRDAALREIDRVQRELERIAAAEQELAGLRSQLEPLPGLARECERLAEMRSVNERRRALGEQVAEIGAELDRSGERLARLEQAPELMLRFAQELEEARAEQREAQAALDERKSGWLRDRQDAETKLQTYRDRAAELREQVRQLREADTEGTCPTCGQPLGANYARLLGELEEQLAEVVQDGKWWKSRREQLEARPEEVVELEARAAELDRAVEERSRKHTRCEAAVHELEVLRGERAAREGRRVQLAAELEALPSGYDAEAHRRAEARLKELRALETRAARLEEAAGRRAGWEREIAEARERERGAAERGEAAAAARAALAFDEAAYHRLRLDHESAAERGRALELRAVELRGQLAGAEQALEAALRAEAQLRERQREIAERELDHRHHNELDAAFTQLRAELNAQVRPELSELASLFLAQLTDGRYTALEIDDDYNILILDEGEEKPVISGGEEDVANLVLRLSLSQMIAERAGHPLSLLILDEVFGSLDVARRDNVVHLLRRLEDRFDQVVLITHVEGIRETLDQVLKVDFDERTGSSVVREQSFVGTDEVLAGVTE